MKIRKIKYKNHNILGNLELDFVNPSTDKPYDTIVLIGENGTGKTSIMSTISDYLNCVSLRHFEYIEYEADGHKYHIEPLETGNPCFHTRKDIVSNEIVRINTDQYNDSERMYSDKKDIRSYASVFSKARADFQVSQIRSISTRTLDSDMRETDNEDNYTSLKQLIVDIDNQDSKDFKNQNRITNVDWTSYYPSSRMYRFAYAFDKFFEKVKFDRIETVSNDNLIIFKKNNQDVPIDSLSTGEKQIVYRGAYLLKNNGNMEDGAVFIDEPELSMHPAWQCKILKYFQDLYITPAGQLKAQMFFASHSEYVVSSALSQPDINLVIVLKEDKGIISAKPIIMPLLLPTIVASEINYAAFGIATVDYHIALYGAIQSKYNVSSITACDNKIASCAPFYNVAQHERLTTNPHNGATYKTVCTKVRNHIDHPDSAPAYTETEMVDSIELMRAIIMNVPS